MTLKTLGKISQQLPSPTTSSSFQSSKQQALCMIRSHGPELITLGRKLQGGISKTKELAPVQPDFPLFLKSHCVTCV